MRIAILCSDVAHPVHPFLQQWAKRHSVEHDIQLVQRKVELLGGDILFLISCHEVVGQDVRKFFKASLVIHASDLPLGRGWSPHIWQILEGKHRIPVTLLEAEDVVDSGAIWAQKIMHLEGHELAGEINSSLFTIELELMDYAVEQFGKIQKYSQDGRKATLYRKRTPEDSRLNPDKTLAEQFDLLRVVDQNRYPAFFDIRGHRYVVKIEKINE